MAQFVYSMNRVGKVVPPKREILKDISLSFFPGAKIGVLGLNGSGKSTLLKIMAGLDTEIIGEAHPMPGLNIGYLPQEPELDDTKTVREVIEESVADVKEALDGLEAVYAAYAEPDADFDELAKKQAQFEDLIQAKDGHNLDTALERAADAMRLPPWDAEVKNLSGGERRRVALCRLLLDKPDMLLLDYTAFMTNPLEMSRLEKHLGIPLVDKRREEMRRAAASRTKAYAIIERFESRRCGLNASDIQAELLTMRADQIKAEAQYA